mmetsp:Transcript_31013/g.99547  ORF Transcript_31013/g.99547 Transcript_31013/m.99547 type:complete len:102 (+) Transcript_31013:89-394(+)
MSLRAARRLTTEEIAQYLDENDLLVEAIKQNQNLGRLHECVQYQLQLQQNLVHLAMHADEQPGIQPLRVAAQQQQPAEAPTGQQASHAPDSDATAGGPPPR